MKKISLKNHADLVAKTCEEINKLITISKHNRKLSSSQIKKVVEIINKSGLRPSLVCNILGVPMETFYSLNKNTRKHESSKHSYDPQESDSLN